MFFKKKLAPLVFEPSATSPVDAAFFTMPEPYRHGAEMKVVEPKALETSKPPTPSVTLPPVTKAKSTSGTIQKKTLSKITLAILIAGAFVILGLLIGGYLLLRQVESEPTSEQSAVTTPIVRPAPEEEKPVESEEPIEESEETEVFPIVAVPGADTDSDGLTNIEEETVYLTNPRLPDTDLDGFLDGNEVFHRYNPNGSAPATLEEAGIAKQQRIEEQVSLLYPTNWISRAVNDPDYAGQWEFVTPTEEERMIVSVASFDSEEAQTREIEKWKETRESFGSTTKNGFPFFVTQDKREAIVDLYGLLVELKYDTGIKTSVDYLQTFQMMINSLLPITF